MNVVWTTKNLTLTRLPWRWNSLQALQCNDLTWLLWRLGLMVAMTTNSCCYDNMLRLLWRYIVVAMGIDRVAKGTRCGYALTLCGCVDMLETELGN